MSNKSKGFLAGAIIGGAAAAAAALLLAPTSGKKLRKELMDQLDDVTDGKASELVDLAQEKSLEFSEIAKEKVSDYPWVSEPFNQVKDGSAEIIDNLKDKTQDISQEFQATSEKLKSVAKPIFEDDIVLSTDDVSDDLTDVIKD